MTSEPVERSYTVTWIIDIDGYSPTDVAQFAREIQLDPTNIATHFHVQDNETGEEFDIDVGEDQ